MNAQRTDNILVVSPTVSFRFGNIEPDDSGQTLLEVFSSKAPEQLAEVNKMLVNVAGFLRARGETRLWSCDRITASLTGAEAGGQYLGELLGALLGKPMDEMNSLILMLTNPLAMKALVGITTLSDKSQMELLPIDAREG